jgi:hypothetical protein
MAKYLTKCAGQLSNVFLLLVSQRWRNYGETVLVSPKVGESTAPDEFLDVGLVVSGSGGLRQ